MSAEQEIDGSCGLENGRRRRWSLEEKRAIVALSLDPECSVAEVASCFDSSRTTLRNDNVREVSQIRFGGRGSGSVTRLMTWDGGKHG